MLAGRGGRGRSQADHQPRAAPAAFAPTDPFFDAPQLSHGPLGRGQVPILFSFLLSMVLMSRFTELCMLHETRFQFWFILSCIQISMHFAAVLVQCICQHHIH